MIGLPHPPIRHICRAFSETCAAYGRYWLICGSPILSSLLKLWRVRPYTLCLPAGLPYPELAGQLYFHGCGRLQF